MTGGEWKKKNNFRLINRCCGLCEHRRYDEENNFNYCVLIKNESDNCNGFLAKDNDDIALFSLVCDRFENFTT